jgi:NAD(P)-dependent dehydrogenase (short-subunit alcohol dehydrogenase family)
VTGGASGIGRALSIELARLGAIVVAADINTEGAGQTASAIRAAGGRASGVHLDVSSPTGVQELVDETVRDYGRLDYMFNNAGIGTGGEVRDMDLEHWRRVLEVNLWGVTCGTSAAYEEMVRQGFGHIVNTASLAGLIPLPMVAAYCATKHAVVGLSASLRAEAAALGIKVSVVCPGFVETGIFEAGIILRVDRDNLLARAPKRIMGAPRAAQLILRGVQHNRGVIVFPFTARLFWWLYRLHPAILMPFKEKIIRDFRSLRIEES